MTLLRSFFVVEDNCAIDIPLLRSSFHFLWRATSKKIRVNPRFRETNLRNLRVKPKYIPL